jgi:DNA mismatch repair protein MutS
VDSGGGRTVLIDQTTLRDLEIFESPDGGGGIFSLLDRTATAGGQTALRRRFKEPSSRLSDIRRSQDAVRFLYQHPGLLRLTEQSVAGVWAYLGSNIAVSKSAPALARAEQAWIALRFGETLRELRTGVEATHQLFGDVVQLCQRVKEAGSPAAVMDLITRLENAAQGVSAAMAAPGGVLGVDRALRHDQRREIEGALRALAELDALQSMAVATRERGWTFPELTHGDRFDLDAEDVIHPFVEDAIPNPAHLSGGAPMVFLTGPNMAGKTTYLKSVALVVLLAQIGMGVPARRMRLTPVEALFTSLSPNDNLRAGLSYFLAEVLRVKAAAALLAEGKRALVLFDEVFKGTNIRDALDASAEVILGFAKARASGFIFSSHLTELVDSLAVNPAIRFCCFDGDIVDGRAHYGYRLRDGVSDKRFGLFLLREAQVPELLAQIGAQS